MMVTVGETRRVYGIKVHSLLGRPDLTDDSRDYDTNSVSSFEVTLFDFVEDPNILSDTPSTEDPPAPEVVSGEQ